MTSATSKRKVLSALMLSGAWLTPSAYAQTASVASAQSEQVSQSDPGEIVEAIRTIALGKRYITPTVAELLAQQLNRKNDALPHENLSEREFQVFLKLAKGQTAGDIAEALSLSVKTVSTYRTRLMEKMGLSSNSDLTYYALKNHLID